MKFVIILYGEQKHLKNLIPVFKNLQNNGFTVININNLSDKNFNSKEYQLWEINGKRDKHPNAKAWKEITPLIINKLNL